MIAQTEYIADSLLNSRKPVSGSQVPLPLRRIAREEVRYLNQIALQRPPLRFYWLSRDWSLQLKPIAAPTLAIAETARIDWGGALIQLRIGQALLETAMGDVLAVDHLGAVEGEIRAVLIDAAFSELATAIETHTRKRFRLMETFASHDNGVNANPIGAVGNCRHGFSLLLSDGNTDYLCEAWLDELALGFLANALRAWQVGPVPGPDWDALPVSFQLMAGWTTMRLDSICRLKLNDVILLDECLIGGEEAQVMIRLSERWGIRGSLTGSTITITDWLDEIMNETDDFDESEEDDEHEFMASTGDDKGDSLDKIPVRMHFDLGERVMTFAELRALAPGYVIELGREVRRSVAIRVNGRKIGEGELVDIDGYIGVSLLSVDPPSV
jgi:type III secretion protein Q